MDSKSPGKGDRKPGLGDQSTEATSYASLLGPPTPVESAMGPVERVKAAFEEPNEFRRLQLFWRALARLKPEHARGIQDLFDEGDRLGRHYPAEYQYFAQRWGEVDGAAAIAHGVQAWRHRAGMEGMMSRMADGWASQDPQAAVEWLNNNSSEAPWMLDAVMSGLVNGLATRDPEGARRLVESQADQPKAAEYFTQLADKTIYTQGLAEAEQWFESLDREKIGASKTVMMDHLADRYLRGGAEQAASFLSRHPDQLSEIPGTVAKVAFEWHRTHPLEAKDWVSTLPETARVAVVSRLPKVP